MLTHQNAHTLILAHELKIMIAKWHAAFIIWKFWQRVRNIYLRKVGAKRLALCERFCGWKMCDMCGEVRPSKKCSGCVRPAAKYCGIRCQKEAWSGGSLVWH